jgi:hypothetical protein
MAKKQKPADAAKDKAAKQKKMAIALICVLALAMAYAVHTMMALGGGTPSSKPQAVDPSATTPATAATNPAATASPAPVAPSLSGAQPVTDPAAAAAAAAASATGSSQLLAAVSPPADPGQLESFSRFESKDPFAGGAASTPASGGTGSTPGTGSGSGGSPGSKPPAPPAVPPAPPSPPPSSAVISVNGLSELVTTGGAFPVASPSAASNGLFELRSLTAKTAKVAVIDGSYASGSQTLTLTVNKPVTLVNTADGTRYTLVLYPQGTAAPAAPAGGSTGSSSGSAATPTTTPATPTTPTTTGG